MRNIEKTEQEMISGGFFAQVMGALAGGVGNTVSTAQGSSNATPGQLAASFGVGAVAGAMATVPGLQTAALTTVVVGNAFIASNSGASNNCSQQCTPSNIDSCGGGGGGGLKVICTELCRNGAIEHEVWMADIRYSRQNFSEQTMRGYHLWGIPYVRLMRKYPAFAKLAEHPTRWFAEDIAYRMGVLSKPNYKGWVLREVFFRPVCFGIGLFAKARDWQALWRDGVKPAGVRS